MIDHEFSLRAARAETDLGTRGTMLDNACDEIERLRAERERLRAALGNIVGQNQYEDATVKGLRKRIYGLRSIARLALTTPKEEHERVAKRTIQENGCHYSSVHKLESR